MHIEQNRDTEQADRVEAALRFHAMSCYDDPLQAELCVAAAMMQAQQAPKAPSRFTRAVKWLASQAAAIL